MNFTILRFDTLDSTNTEALNQAKRGAGEGLCVVAREQTAGRGRHGREWISGANAGLYFSLLLRPTIENKFLSLITLMTAVAVADVLNEIYAIKSDIKWANDIHVGGKKICGILAEMTETNSGTAIVVGIGINLKSSNFPAELEDSATSIEAETKIAPDIEKLMESLTKNLSKFYALLHAADGAAQIRREWTRRSSYAVGKNVIVKLANESFTGTTCGIKENGALLVEMADGEIKIVQAGDVERLRKSPDEKTAIEFPAAKV